MSSVYPRDVTQVSKTKGDIDAGQDMLTLRHSPDGKVYRLVRAGETIPDGYAVQQSDLAGYSAIGDVKKAILPNTPVLGVNNTGKSINAGEYFWALCKGPGYAYVTGTAGAGGGLEVDSGTPGEFKAVGTGFTAAMMSEPSSAAGKYNVVLP